MDKLQEYRTALVRLDKLSLMLGEVLRLTRVGWDCIEGEKSSEAILGQINRIAKWIGEAIPEDIKCTRPTPSMERRELAATRFDKQPE